MNIEEYHDKINKITKEALKSKRNITNEYALERKSYSVGDIVQDNNNTMNITRCTAHYCCDKDEEPYILYEGIVVTKSMSRYQLEVGEIAFMDGTNKNNQMELIKRPNSLDTKQ